MTRSIILYLLLVVSLVSCIAGDDESVSGSGNVVEVGNALPTFSVRMNDGTSLTNETLKGKVAVLTFFHTACGDCQRELPMIQQAYNEFAQQVSFACISRAEDETSVAAYWKQHGLGIPFSGQTDSAVYSLFAKHTIPRIYVIDSKGIIRYQFVEKMDIDQLRANIRSLLAD